MLWAPIAALVSVALPLQLPAQGGERLIAGRVVDQATGAPLSSAAVQVRGALRSVLTNEQGGFSLRVANGATPILVRRIGYSPVDRLVKADETEIAVAMTRDALQLDEVVVTGQATGVSRRNAPTSVAIVSSEDLTRVSSQSLEHSLQGKVAGAQITQRTGQPGGGVTVRIRGVSSVFGSAITPLYVLDGVIVNDLANANGQTRVTNGAGVENPINRVADLDPNEIEHIEVLKGPAAAAIYGAKAGAGVIMITTKRGTVGRPQLTMRAGGGTSSLAYRNGHRAWTKDLAVARFGAAAAAYFDAAGHQLVDLDYESMAYDNRPRNGEVSASVTGGSPETRYFASVLVRDERGIVQRTGARKLAVRGNADQRIADRVQLQIGSTVLHTVANRGLFGNENNFSSVGDELPKVPSFMDLRMDSTGAWPRNPFAFSNPLQTIALVKNQEDTWRTALSTRLQWNWIESRRHDLQFIGYGGADVAQQNDDIYSPPELYYEARKANPGSRAITTATDVFSNANLNIVHRWRPRDGIAATSQLGTQLEKWTEAWIQDFANNLTSGLSTVGAAPGANRTADEWRSRTVDVGLFAQSEWLLGDRLFLTGGVRADRSSNNADAARFFFFPKSSASYRWSAIPVPGLFDGRPVVDELKWRVAYGESGNRAQYGSRFTSLGQVSVGGVTAFVPGNARAAADIRPERQRELETGVDASLFDRRASVEVTGYRRTISDLLLNRGTAPSTGYTGEFANAGSLRTWGLETVLSAVPLRGPVDWTSRITFGSTRSRVISIPGDSVVVFGTSLTQGQVWLRPGHSATEIMGNDTLPQSPRRIVPVSMGDGAPRWVAGWSNEVRWRRITGYVLLDRQSGGLLWSGTWRIYDAQQNSRDYDDLTPAGLKAGDVRNAAVNAVTRIYTQDATSTKLREVSVAWELPRGIASRLAGARSAQIQLSGRNLKWWTKFRGGDPEAENFGGGFGTALQRNRELTPYPSSRTYWLAVTVNR